MKNWMNCRVIVFSNYLATVYVLLLIHLCHASLLFSQSPITENQYVKNELLISFKKGISKEQITIFENVYQLKRLKEFKHINIYHYQINKSTTVPELIKEIKKNTWVRFVEPNYRVMDILDGVPLLMITPPYPPKISGESN